MNDALMIVITFGAEVAGMELEVYGTPYKQAQFFVKLLGTSQQPQDADTHVAFAQRRLDETKRRASARKKRKQNKPNGVSVLLR